MEYIFSMLRDFATVRAVFLDSLSWAGLVKYFAAILLLKFVHETAHSLAAIHFNCRVRGIGLGFTVFYPRLYTSCGAAGRSWPFGVRYPAHLCRNCRRCRSRRSCRKGRRPERWFLRSSWCTPVRRIATSANSNRGKKQPFTCAVRLRPGRYGSPP